ncbi:MAG: methyltransferase [Saccharospirillaceae bacterium]|nr:methyltransferase [Pseudomonadales bacterium]NRB80124.1 methyltransferase [Saccharospirillaceae bacterium]
MIRKRLPKKSKSSEIKTKLLPFDYKQLITIERLSHEGDGIGFSQGYTVSVPFTIPGESVLIEKPQIKGHMVNAKIKTIQSRSDNRVEPVCEYYGQCGGCDYQHINYTTQIELKQQQFLWQFKSVLFKDLKSKKPSQIDTPLISKPFEYRHRIRLSVKGGVVGFMKPGSNDLIQIDNCSITHPLIQQKLKLSQHRVISQLHGLLSIEWLVDDEDQIALRLVMKKSPSQIKIDEVIELLKSNEISNYRIEMGTKIVQLGKQLLQKNDDLLYRYQPGQFTQVNTSVNQKMLDQAQRWILDTFEKNELPFNKALDLFCGMGNFTLMLAKHFKNTIGIEGSKDSIVCARQNSEENKKNTELNTLKFIKQDLFANDWRDVILQQQFDLVVLDPPRAGAKQICTDIVQLKSKYVLYISCNQSTLLRDAQLLKERGYGIERANIMDMFAQTHHIETMVLFRKL